MERIDVHYAGRVQGVGFRHTVRQISKRYQVDGYVRNLEDGRVELVAEGETAELDRFLAAIETEMRGKIHQCHVSRSPAGGTFREFEIRY